MTLYIGVDIHARQQTVSYLDTEDGIIEQRELHHERDDIRAFYSQSSGEVIVGIELVATRTGFEELIDALQQPRDNCFVRNKLSMRALIPVHRIRFLGRRPRQGITHADERKLQSRRHNRVAQRP